MKRMKTRVLGHVSVDSGQVLIVDPCYLKDWQHGEMGHCEPNTDGPGWTFEDEPKNHYDECAHATLSAERGGAVLDELAVASSTGYGDGTYAVLAEVNREGRIVRLVIDFDAKGDWDNDPEQCECKGLGYLDDLDGSYAETKCPIHSRY